jgi:hypothetical protein
MEQKICQSCGNVFYKKVNVSSKNWLNAKYCSHPCSLQFTSVQKVNGNYWLGKKIPDEVRQKISKSCKGRPANSGCFKKGQVGINLGRKFPSLTGSNNPRFNSIEKSCLNCGKTILVQKYRQETQKWCDTKCYMKWRRGENNPRYKGDEATTKLKKRIIVLAEYKEWRNDVYNRDNFTCQSCNKRGGNLEVHHLKSFVDIYKEFNLKTIQDARNCKILWDISNGQTLCRKCHRKTDSYGRHK